MKEEWKQLLKEFISYRETGNIPSQLKDVINKIDSEELFFITQDIVLFYKSVRIGVSTIEEIRTQKEDTGTNKYYQTFFDEVPYISEMLTYEDNYYSHNSNLSDEEVEEIIDYVDANKVGILRVGNKLHRF